MATTLVPNFKFVLAKRQKEERRKKQQEEEDEVEDGEKNASQSASPHHMTQSMCQTVFFFLYFWAMLFSFQSFNLDQCKRRREGESVLGYIRP